MMTTSTGNPPTLENSLHTLHARFESFIENIQQSSAIQISDSTRSSCHAVLDWYLKSHPHMKLGIMTALLYIKLLDVCDISHFITLEGISSAKIKDLVKKLGTPPSSMEDYPSIKTQQPHSPKSANILSKEHHWLSFGEDLDITSAPLSHAHILNARPQATPRKQSKETAQSSISHNPSPRSESNEPKLPLPIPNVSIPENPDYTPKNQIVEKEKGLTPPVAPKLRRCIQCGNAASDLQNSKRHFCQQCRPTSPTAQKKTKSNISADLTDLNEHGNCNNFKEIIAKKRVNIAKTIQKKSSPKKLAPSPPGPPPSSTPTQDSLRKITGLADRAHFYAQSPLTKQIATVRLTIFKGIYGEDVGPDMYRKFIPELYKVIPLIMGRGFNGMPANWAGVIAFRYIKSHDLTVKRFTPHTVARHITTSSSLLDFVRKVDTHPAVCRVLWGDYFGDKKML